MITARVIALMADSIKNPVVRIQTRPRSNRRSFFATHSRSSSMAVSMYTLLPGQPAAKQGGLNLITADGVAGFARELQGVHAGATHAAMNGVGLRVVGWRLDGVLQPIEYLVDHDRPRRVPYHPS